MTLQSFDDVRQLKADLEALSAWRDVLLWKLNTPSVHFKFVSLIAEVREFERECKALTKAYRSEA